MKGQRCSNWPGSPRQAAGCGAPHAGDCSKPDAAGKGSRCSGNSPPHHPPLCLFDLFRQQEVPAAASNVQNRAAGLLPSWLDPFPLLCHAPAAKSARLICVEIHIVQSFPGPGRLGAMGAVPSAAPARAVPGRHSGLGWGALSPICRPEQLSHTKGSLWNVGLGMKGRHLSRSVGRAGS